MSAIPSPASWLQLIAVVALGSAATVLLAALLCRLTRAAVWRRTIWRASTLGLVFLLIGELTGVADGALRLWSRQSRASGEATIARTLPSGAADQPSRFPLGEREPRTSAADSAGMPAEELAVTSDTSAAAATLDSSSPVPTRPMAGAGAPPTWWPGLLWLGGAVAVGGRILVARLLLAVFRRRCRSASEGTLSDRALALAQRLGIRRRVCVLQAPGLVGPAAFGVVRPTLVLPAHFADDFDAVAQEAMLAHELAHLAARDPDWLLAADLVSAALWWHPLIWWSRLRLRMASEAAADEASLVVADGPQALAACLVALGQRLTQARQAGWVPMAGSGFRSSLGRRVERLVQFSGGSWQPPSRFRSGLVLLFGPASLVAAAFLSTAWVRPQTSANGDVPMKTMHDSWQRSLAGFILCTALGSGSEATHASGPPDKAPNELKLADPEVLPKKPREEAPYKVTTEEAPYKVTTPGGEAKEKSEAAPRRIRVFRLRYSQPEELLEILQGLLPRTSSAATGSSILIPGGARAPGGAYGPAGPATVGKPYGGQTYSGGMKPSGARGPGVPGPGVSYPAGPGGFPGPSWRLAVDNRSGSLIMRGSEKELEIAAELVAVLDSSSGKTMPKVKSLRAYKLRHANAEELSAVLQNLELDARIMPAPRSNTLIITGPEEAIREIDEVIEALDVAGPGEPKGGPAKHDGLFEKGKP